MLAAKHYDFAGYDFQRRTKTRDSISSSSCGRCPYQHREAQHTGCKRSASQVSLCTRGSKLSARLHTKAAGCLALQSRPASSAVVVSVLFAVCMTYAYNTAAPAHAIRRACCQQVHDRAPCGSGCSITRTTNNDSKTARARTAPLMKPNDHRAFKGVAG
jgi:hypothetical protein